MDTDRIVYSNVLHCIAKPDAPKLAVSDYDYIFWPIFKMLTIGYLFSLKASILVQLQSIMFLQVETPVEVHPIPV